MAASVDPTYPLYPIVSALTAVMLLLVLLTSFVRQSWSLGVAFLCFWLGFENLTFAVNAVLWSDNVDIKHYAYCDIVSRVQMIAFVVKPIATLIITRRLYLIISLCSVDRPNHATVRWDRTVEWTLGLGIPLLVAGPFYYVNQDARFQILEGFGCTNTMARSILEILLVRSWSIVPPLLSVVIYYSRMVRVFYHHTKVVNRLLHEHTTVSRKSYLRVLALASLDILLTLPFGIVNIVLSTIVAMNQVSAWADIEASGRSALPQDLFSNWTSPVLALAIFGLFGLTTEARDAFGRIFCVVGGWFGRRLSPGKRDSRPSESLGAIEFEERSEETVREVKQGSPTGSVGFEVVMLREGSQGER